MKRLSFILAAGAILVSAASAFGQGGAILQGGPWTPGHAPMYVGQSSGQAIVQTGIGRRWPYRNGPCRTIADCP